MASVALSLVLLAGAAAAQSSSVTTTSYAASSTVDWPATPLISLSYPRPSDAPYQVFPYDGHDIFTRGYQSGYNICNSTTEGDSSLCQTIVQNGIDGTHPLLQAGRAGLHALRLQTSACGARPR